MTLDELLLFEGQVFRMPNDLAKAEALEVLADGLEETVSPLAPEPRRAWAATIRRRLAAQAPRAAPEKK